MAKNRKFTQLVETVKSIMWKSTLLFKVIKAARLVTVKRKYKEESGNDVIEGSRRTKYNLVRRKLNQFQKYQVTIDSEKFSLEDCQ